MNPGRILLVVTALTVLPAQAAIVMSWPTNVWRPVALASGNPMDYLSDQQTGQANSDMVGTTQEWGLFMLFDPDNPQTIAFRVRLGALDGNGGTFERGFFIGIDANGDGALDLFTGVDNTGAAQNHGIKIFDAGNGLNTGPSTTTMVVPTNQKVYQETSANYDYRAVDAIINPGGAPPFDLDNDGNVDYYLSFSVPYQDIIGEMLRLRGLTITDSSPLRFVGVTSTQNNAFNQDLGGINGGINSTSTWTQLGGISNPMPPVNQFAVPEPGTIWLAGIGAALLAAGAARRRAR